MSRFEHTLDIRTSVLDNPEKAWNSIQETLENAQKTWENEKVENIQVIEISPDDIETEDTKTRLGLDVNGKRLPLTAKGRAALEEQLGLNGFMSGLSKIPDEAYKNEVSDKVLQMIMKDKKNMNLRIHTADFNGHPEVIHVASTKFGAVSELELVNQIREAAQERNYFPARLYVDVEKVRMQLLQIDDTFELALSEDDAHRWVGSTVDAFMGALTVTLSETVAANEIRTGLYRSLCTNMAIGSLEEDVELKAVRKAKSSFGIFLSAAFQAIEKTKSVDRFMKALQALQATVFGLKSLQGLEAMISDANVLRPYNEFIKDDVKALVDVGTERAVYDLLSEKAHDNRIPARHQLALEQVSGMFLLPSSR